MSDVTISVSDARVDVDGGALFAQRWQPEGADRRAPSILLFHDSLGCVELWRGFPQMLAAATGLTVIAYDRLGFGRSDRCTKQYGREFIGEEARVSVPALRAALGFDRFIAFGHSVGGGMAVTTAAVHPEACVAVITESAQAFTEDRTLEGIRAAEKQFADPQMLARLARYHGDKAQWVLDAWIKTWQTPPFADWSLDETLAQVRCPVLAMHGDGDEFGSWAHPERIAALSAGPATKVFFENCGHVPHREQPERVLETVKRFLVSAGVMTEKAAAA